MNCKTNNIEVHETTLLQQFLPQIIPELYTIHKSTHTQNRELRHAKCMYTVNYNRPLLLSIF